MGSAAEEIHVDLTLPEKLGHLLTERARYKVAYGGRGSAKSWSYARALVWLAVAGHERILCARETQESIADSVHRLLVDQIEALGLSELFSVTRDRITCPSTESEILFAGVRTDPRKIKSLERITRCWVEEAEAVSDASWEILIPTIREDNSEIWVTFNPGLASDPTWKRFVVSPPSDAIVVQMSWRDNPWFPPVLDQERRDLMARDTLRYRHVWEGECGVLGTAYFPVEAIDHVAASVCPPKAVGVLEQVGTSVRLIHQEDGWLEIWDEPGSGDYVIGGDVAEDVHGGDRHSGHVLSRGLVVQQVARIAPQCGPDEFGRRLVLAAQYYGGRVPMGIERNSIGVAAVIAARDTNYEHLFRMPTAEGSIRGRDSDRLGWATTQSSRPLMLSELSTALLEGSLDVRSSCTLEQIRSFAVHHGKPQAMPGCHDDEVMGIGIAYQMVSRTDPIQASTRKRGRRKPRGTWMG